MDNQLEGFTLWPGGDCPVAPNTKVEYILRETAPMVEEVLRAAALRWEHTRRDDDIIAYRVVAEPEWRLPDPPEGKQWHRQDWTKEMLPDGYRPLLLGEVEQAEDWFCGPSGEWRQSPHWSSDGARPNDRHRRTRRPLPASPKPWDCPDDVPGPVCWMREKGYTDQHAGLVVYVFDFCLDIAGRGRKRWSELSSWEYSTDRKTWRPCVKEVK